MTFEQSIIYLAGIIDGEGCIGIECMAPCKKKMVHGYENIITTHLD